MSLSDPVCWRERREDCVTQCYGVKVMRNECSSDLGCKLVRAERPSVMGVCS